MSAVDEHYREIAAQGRIEALVKAAEHSLRVRDHRIKELEEALRKYQKGNNYDESLFSEADMLLKGSES